MKKNKTNTRYVGLVCDKGNSSSSSVIDHVDSNFQCDLDSSRSFDKLCFYFFLVVSLARKQFYGQSCLDMGCSSYNKQTNSY